MTWHLSSPPRNSDSRCADADRDDRAKTHADARDWPRQLATDPSVKRRQRCEIELLLTYFHCCGVNSFCVFENARKSRVFKKAVLFFVWRSLCKLLRFFEKCVFQKTRVFKNAKTLIPPYIQSAGKSHEWEHLT